jgi:hypothetical protein
MLHTQLYKYLNQRENPSCPSLEIVYSRGASLSLGAVELLLRVSNLFPSHHKSALPSVTCRDQKLRNCLY